MNNTTAGGTIPWAEAPADPTQSQDWTLHKIDAIPTSHRLRWADLDGDGKKELIVLPIFGVGSSAPSHAGAVQLKAFFIPKDPKAANATWTAQVIDNSHLETAHGLEVVDWDGDKAADILTAANDGVDLVPPVAGQGRRAPGRRGRAERPPTRARARSVSAASAARASSPPSSPGTAPTASSTRRAPPRRIPGSARCSARTSSTATAWSSRISTATATTR